MPAEEAAAKAAAEQEAARLAAEGGGGGSAAAASPDVSGGDGGTGPDDLAGETSALNADATLSMPAIATYGDPADSSLELSVDSSSVDATAGVVAERSASDATASEERSKASPD